MTEDECNVRSATYYIAVTTVKCRHCGAETSLAALAVPRDHEIVNDDEHPDDLPPDAPRVWEPAATVAFLFYVNRISNRVSARVGALCANFRYGFFDQSSIWYWGNTCGHCDSTLEDHDEQCEPGGAFCPLTREDAARITLVPVAEPFQALADGYAPDPAFFESMRHDSTRSR